jgi:hypothetical protein
VYENIGEPACLIVTTPSACDQLPRLRKYTNRSEFFEFQHVITVNTQIFPFSLRAGAVIAAV